MHLAIRPKGELKKREIGWKQLHLLWFDVKSVKGRKEGKNKEIKGEAIQPVSKKRSPNEWLRTVQSWRIVWVRAGKREEKNIE